MSDITDVSQEEEEPDSKELLETESRASLPAIYIDTWYLTTWKGHMRIAFGETVSGQDHYRSAVVLELRDAERLSRQMAKMIERRKRKDIALAASEAEETPDASTSE